MTQIIDLLLTAIDEPQALANLDQVGWVGSDEEGQPIIQPPIKCAAMPITLWRKQPKLDLENGDLIDAGEQVPGYWLGLCIPDPSMLEELWSLPGVVAALERSSGKILRLKGFSLAEVNALDAIQPVWAGSNYHWSSLEMENMDAVPQP